MAHTNILLAATAERRSDLRPPPPADLTPAVWEDGHPAPSSGLSVPTTWVCQWERRKGEKGSPGGSLPGHTPRLQTPADRRPRGPVPKGRGLTGSRDELHERWQDRGIQTRRRQPQEEKRRVCHRRLQGRACGSHSSPLGVRAPWVSEPPTRRRSARTVQAALANTSDSVSPRFTLGAPWSACPLALEESRTEIVCHSYAKNATSFTGLPLNSRGYQARDWNPP